MIVKYYNKLVNFLSFGKNSHELRLKINKRIDIPEKIEELPNSHPRGFIKEFRKRRTTIVESYLRINQSLESSNYNERLHALSLLAEHIIHSRSLKMPLNTARVQLALMKQVVKNRDNKRAQLELMSDFTISSFGHPRVIRKYLKRLDIIEVQETSDELKNIIAAWDFHVHDNASYGRKSPTNLIIDAFIKGISELTIAHNNLDKEDAIREVLDAGQILGIKVNIAIEFNALTNGKRFHYMYILPEFSSKKKLFKKAFKKKTDDFKEFMHELQTNQQRRKRNIKALVDEFNNTHLLKLNHGYSADSIYYFKPLNVNDNNPLWNQINSRQQLGEFLYPMFMDIFEKRALAITAQYVKMHKSLHLYTALQITEIKKQYNHIREQYSNLSPENIKYQYFSDIEQVKPETAVSSLAEIYLLAKSNKASIKFIQPLEHGLQAAVDVVLENCEFLSHTEIYNMVDRIDTPVNDFVVFTKFINYLNKNNKKAIEALFQKNNLNVEKSKIEKAIKNLQHRKIVPSIGSDAKGSSILAPGMGFIFENQLPKWQQRYFAKKHEALPSQVSELIYKEAKFPKIPLKKKEKAQIFCLGQIQEAKKNELGDERNEKPIPPAQVWEYFNPSIKNLLFILVGFLPAYYTVGIQYALLWFTITGLRNIFVDLISGNGLNPRRWNTNDINWTNVSNSLFWTGFSVPILGFIKAKFDIIWMWPHIGFWYEFGKFFFINIANGTYLASHNYIRGFDRATIRANFFRSIIAWPFSVIFSPFGNSIGVLSIVQAKFWSDFVASIIEGSGKYRNIIKIKNRIMVKLMPDLLSEDPEIENLAILDLIYFANESNRAKTAIKQQLITSINTKFSFKKLNPIKKESKNYTEYYYAIKNFIEKEQHFNELTDYIIRNYKKDQSLYLLNLLALNYHKFQHWLKSI
jgi:predicted transcriptional regulator